MDFLIGAVSSLPAHLRQAGAGTDFVFHTHDQVCCNVSHIPSSCNAFLLQIFAGAVRQGADGGQCQAEL